MNTEYGDYNKNFSPEVIRTMCDFTSPMTSALIKLYNNFWSDYKLKDSKLRKNNALPYLLAPSRNYENADIKIMVCGKESMDWGHGNSEFQDTEPSTMDMMKLYDFWINGNGGSIMDNGSYGPFMKFYAEWFKYWFEDHLSEDEILKHKVTLSIRSIGCIASNIIKISKKGTGFEHDLNEPFYYIFGEEVDILKPDIIVATVYKKEETIYRQILDEKFGLRTVEYDFNGNEEYRRIPIDNRYLYLMRHPRQISDTLKNKVWNDIRQLIVDKFL